MWDDQKKNKIQGSALSLRVDVFQFSRLILKSQNINPLVPPKWALR